jgi:ribA/ribD-fused uncharacterized protein
MAWVDHKDRYRITATHVYFHGSPLSNWHIGKPFSFHLPVVVNDEKGRRITQAKEPLLFNCGEQAMMAGKASLFGDLEIRDEIMKKETPKEQKALGRDVTPFNQKTWDAVNIPLVTMICYSRGAQDDEVFDFVMASGNKSLVEGSAYDKVWGVGVDYTDRRIENEANWIGEGRLTNAWEDARMLLREHGRTADPWVVVSDMIATRNTSSPRP